jgi:hypothetical protein
MNAGARTSDAAPVDRVNRLPDMGDLRRQRGTETVSRIRARLACAVPSAILAVAFSPA